MVVRLEGERRRGTATAYPVAEAVAERVKRVLDADGVDVARRIGLEIEGERIPDPEILADAIEQTVTVEIELGDR